MLLHSRVLNCIFPYTVYVCECVCVCIYAIYIHKRTRDLLIYDDLQVLGAPEWDILLVVH